MGDDDVPATRLQRRSRLWAVPAGMAVVAAVALGVTWPDPAPETSAATGASAAPTLVPSSSAPSTADPSPAASPTAAPRPAPVPSPPRPTPTAAPAAPSSSGGVLPPVSAPVWLTVEAARIDQPIVALTPTPGDLAAQSIVPPMTMDAYWLTSYGSPGAGSSNTTYLTGHSWEGADAPFDRLSTDVAPGDAIVLGTATGTIRYIVESVTTHDKNTLKTSEIWAVVPNRLVLVSCFTADPWGRNVVVTAVPAG